MQTNTKPPGYSNRNPNLSFMPWAVKEVHKLEILKIKDLKTKNRIVKKEIIKM